MPKKRKSPFTKEEKNKRRKRFYWIPENVFKDKRLEASDKLVYAMLVGYADNAAKKHCPSSSPSLEKMVEASNLPSDVIRNSIKILEEMDFIKITREIFEISL